MLVMFTIPEMQWLWEEESPLFYPDAQLHTAPHTFSTLYPVLQLMTTWSLKVYLAWEGSIFPLIGGCTSGHGLPLNKKQMNQPQTQLNT